MSHMIRLGLRQGDIHAVGKVDPSGDRECSTVKAVHETSRVSPY